MEESKMDLATITILVTSRQTHSPELNKILSDNGHLIMSRLGVNVQPKCIQDCVGLIVVVAKGHKDDIQKLNADIDAIDGISSHLVLATQDFIFD